MSYEWYFKGKRPSKKASVSRTYTHILGAVCALTGCFFGITAPWLNAEVFPIFLEHFARFLHCGEEGRPEIWLAVDRAGWHLAKELRIPAGMTLLEMPTGAAQINPAERVWKYVRDQYTRCYVFKDAKEQEKVLRKAILELEDSPGIIQSRCEKPEIINQPLHR